MATVDVSRQAPFGVVPIDLFSSYVIDPRTETCLLQRGNSAQGWMSAVPVSCGKLKRSVPEAARLITWDTGDEAAPAPAQAPAPVSAG